MPAHRALHHDRWSVDGRFVAFVHSRSQAIDLLWTHPLRAHRKQRVKQQQWRAVWRGKDIVVKCDGKEVDRIAAAAIRRVIFVERGVAQSAADHAFAVVELEDDFVLFPADSGLAGLVHFERQSFWGLHPCVYWADSQQAVLPSAVCRHGSWFTRRALPDYGRVARSVLAASIDSWPLEGPQTWEQRRWTRIAAKRGFGARAPSGAVAELERQTA